MSRSPLHVCFYANQCKWSKAFITELAATPYKEGGQWQTCGTVSKTVDGEAKQHRFIRADRFSDEDAAADHAILKGQQIIDQLGERVFS